MHRLQANFLLLIAAAIWGSTFVVQQSVLQYIGPQTFTSLRFLLGALVIAPLAAREYRLHVRQGTRFARSDLASAGLIGLLLFGGITLQQLGVADTLVSHAGFLTALYIPLVPLLAWLLRRQRPPAATWPAVAGCLLGTWLLTGGSLSGWHRGDLLIIASTVFWGLHMIYLGPVANRKNTPLLLALIQYLICASLAGCLSLGFEQTSLAALQNATPFILFGGIGAAGIAFTLQIVALRYTRASDAAIQLASEPLFASLSAALFLGEHLSAAQLGGCGVILLCVLAVQLLPAQPGAHGSR